MSVPLGVRQQEFTLAVAKLILVADGLGIKLRMKEVMRDIERQKTLVAEKKSKTMNSRHLDCLAVDFVACKNGEVFTSGEIFRALGECWESMGGRWGGRFGFEDQPKEVQAKKLGWDTPHFEFKP
jgi:hypothetical protein